MKILIIGSGWYGCHLGMILKKNNINFEIWEKNNTIFNEASYNNQNRLHLGYHYPRSYNTRKLCREGYTKFINTYGFVVDDLDNNYYLVSSYDSLMDGDTYKHIYKYENYELKEDSNNDIINYQLLFESEEKVINHIKAKEYFEKELNEYVKLNKKVLKTDLKQLESIYDYVFDCTNNMLGLVCTDIFYEKTLSLIYKSKNNKKIGITVMDGEFASLYPYNTNDNTYTLTHVKYTPLIKTTSLQEAVDYKEIVNNDVITKFETDICRHYPKFNDEFQYVDYFTSYKTKLKDKSDSRELYIYNNNEHETISFICGKITGIFMMEQYINKILFKSIFPNTS
jgi:hypothetical protein